MDHGHGGHDDMDMGPKCSMHMLWCVQCTSALSAVSIDPTAGILR